MSDDNKHNLLYFEAPTMKELFETMENWQQNNQRRLLSTNIQQDQGKFCCIALSNPTEVIICNGSSSDQVRVKDFKLWVNTYA
jgi:hypothetical protein